MHEIERICVFAGSSPGRRPEYVTAARALGRALADERIGLVYGGAGVGLMGAVADAVLDRGGSVVGVMPRALVEREVAHAGLTELGVVGSMHERKAEMADLADAFVALPGGLGTLEEMFEVLTWAQLGHHVKPCGLLNVAGYYDPMLSMMDHAVEERFVAPEHRAMILVDVEPGPLIERFRAYRPPQVSKWLDRKAL